ncbi:MAG: hypothetical protein ABW321_01740 [Polyangiales bacterium]
MTNKRIERLRNRLLESGRPTQFPRAVQAEATPELSALADRVRPFAEVMYLVLAADTEITERERDLLRGTLRTLTEGALSSTTMDGMLKAFERDRARDGVELRLDYLASSLYPDRSDARLAIGLATAAADADRGIGPEERELIQSLGERLGISRRELQELFHDTSPTAETR